MRVRLLKSVKDGSGWHEPGAIVDLSDEDANSLVRMKSAELLNSAIGDSTPSDQADAEAESEGEEYTDEELKEIAEKLKEIDGVNEEIAYRLIESGFLTIQSVAEADRDDLIAIKGIGKKNVGKIQESAEDIQDSTDE